MPQITNCMLPCKCFNLNPVLGMPINKALSWDSSWGTTPPLSTWHHHYNIYLFLHTASDQIVDVQTASGEANQTYIIWDIIDQYNAIGSLIVARGDGPESFLTSSVPLWGRVHYTWSYSTESEPQKYDKYFHWLCPESTHSWSKGLISETESD